MSVGQFAKTDVKTIFPDATIKEAASSLRRHNIGFLVVVDRADPTKVVGVVSERDIVRAVAEGIELGRPVAEIATKNVVAVDVEDPLRRAVELMRAHNIRHLVVLKDGKLYGVLSIRDLVYEDHALKVISGYDEWTFERGMSA
ncbi:MAG: CBS domain-containing protein [Thermoproteus sp. AZ2]|uniref:CBS domain-containing protein n=1 Tax=Thermoproteus sp. AZ2 TaxID=1609232 RepID=A0ACC6UZY5_9CREN